MGLSSRLWQILGKEDKGHDLSQLERTWNCRCQRTTSRYCFDNQATITLISIEIESRSPPSPHGSPPDRPRRASWVYASVLITSFIERDGRLYVQLGSGLSSGHLIFRRPATRRAARCRFPRSNPAPSNEDPKGQR